MHSKDNNKINNFIQGLRPFASSLPKTLKKYLRKGGYNYSNIVDNWTRIVSKSISDSCYPTSVKMGKEMRMGTLMLNVRHGKELEIEYSKAEIIDKINSFFGYECISNVKLKIVQEKVDTKEIDFPKIKNKKKIVKNLEEINSSELKSSLNNLVKAFNERNK